MELALRNINNVTVIQITGRIDTATALPLRTELARLAGLQPARIVADLSAVHFIDSSGLAALVQGMRSCRASGGDLYLSGLQRPVRMIFELTRLDSALEIYPREEDAVAAFGQMLRQ